MKKFVQNFLGIMCLLTICTTSFAQISQRDIQRSLTRATLFKQAEATVMFEFTKVVHARDVMNRPLRGGARNVVIGYQTEHNICKGFLTNTRQIVTPALCTEKNDFKFQKFLVKLANGKMAEGTTESLFIKGDIAYLRINTELTQGLQGVKLETVDAGVSLADKIGSRTLISFLESKGIPAKRHYRIGKYRASQLKVGDGLLYNGKLVALVQRIPTHYLTVFGRETEDFFAIIR